MTERSNNGVAVVALVSGDAVRWTGTERRVVSGATGSVGVVVVVVVVMVEEDDDKAEVEGDEGSEGRGRVKVG